ncbi:hypothetical protein KHQ81_00885 [Mycoplasmatota bacterium]|nr:hypothetical protein KHQ81_00885 [Mycoplasmatota bacterium]
MKKGIKFLIFLNIICYINLFILSYRTSLVGMNIVNQIWLVSPYLFVFIFLYSFSPSYSTIKKYSVIDYVIRILAILICYKASNFNFNSKTYIILTSIAVLIFIINFFLEVRMYNKIKQYCDNNEDKKGLSLNDVMILSKDKEINEQFKKSGKRTLRSLFNWWNLIFAWVIFMFSIVFLKSDISCFMIIAIILLLIVTYLVIKSILSHLIVFHYVDYTDDYKKKRKIINVGGIILAFISVFFITFLGGEDLAYCNGLVIIFFLPLYRTEKYAIIKEKEELDQIVENKKV